MGHFHLQTESKFGTFSLTSHRVTEKFAESIANYNKIRYNAYEKS